MANYTTAPGNRPFILAPVQVNGLWGFIDTSGQLVIEAKFELEPDMLYPQFKEGIAVMKSFDKQRYGIIDTAGEWVVDPVYFKIYEFHEGFTNIMVNRDDKLNKLIDREGNLYDFSEYTYVGRYNAGLAIAEKNGMYGYIDNQGEEVLPFIYYDADEFSTGMAAVDIGEKFDNRGRRISKYGYISRHGKLVIPAQYDFAFAFMNRVGIVAIDDREGVIDMGGKMLIPPRYLFPPNCNNFEKGVAFAHDYEEYQMGNHKVGLLNLDGEWMAAPAFDRGEVFSEGFAPVQVGDKWGYIDYKGKWIIPPRFSYGNGFKNGLAPVVLQERYGYIDEEGNTKIPFGFEDAGQFSSGMAAVKKDNKYGYINPGGEWIISPRFENAGMFHNVNRN